MDYSFTCKLHHACLSFVSIHQMAPPLTEIADIQLQLTTHLSTPRGWNAKLAWWYNRANRINSYSTLNPVSTEIGAHSASYAVWDAKLMIIGQGTMAVPFGPKDNRMGLALHWLFATDSVRCPSAGSMGWAPRLHSSRSMSSFHNSNPLFRVRRSDPKP